MARDGVEVCCCSLLRLRGVRCPAVQCSLPERQRVRLLLWPYIRHQAPHYSSKAPGQASQNRPQVNGCQTNRQGTQKAGQARRRPHQHNIKPNHIALRHTLHARHAALRLCGWTGRRTGSQHACSGSLLQVQAGSTAASGSQAALRGTLQRAPTVLSSWPLLPSGEASSAQKDPPCQAQQHSCALGHVSGLLPLADAGLRVVVVRPALAVVHL